MQRRPEETDDGDGGQLWRGTRGAADLSSVFAEAAASTRSVRVMTQTVTADDTTATPTADVPAATGTAAAARPTPTTWATQTWTNAPQQSGPAETATSDTPRPVVQHTHHSGLTPGQLAAAVVVPVVFAALLALLACLILRRRRRRRHEDAWAQSSGSRTSSNTTRHGCWSLRDKWDDLRSSASSQQGPGSTAPHHGDGGHSSAPGTASEDSPPPYEVTALPRLPGSHEMSQFSIPSTAVLRPISPISALTADLPPPNPAFLPRNRAASMRSFNSDAYSETASIHSARAARMSVGGPLVVSPGTHASGSPVHGEGSPFHDSTPVTSRTPPDALASLEGRSST